MSLRNAWRNPVHGLERACLLRQQFFDVRDDEMPHSTIDPHSPNRQDSILDVTGLDNRQVLVTISSVRGIYVGFRLNLIDNEHGYHIFSWS